LRGVEIVTFDARPADLLGQQLRDSALARAGDAHHDDDGIVQFVPPFRRGHLVEPPVSTTRLSGSPIERL